MRLIEIIGNDGVVPRLKAQTRDEALMELVNRLIENGRVNEEDREDLLMALLKRESLGATSIGHNVAIPHVKTPLANEFVGVLGRSRDGIDFAEGEDKVHLIILFFSPERAVSGHLRLLAHIGGILNHDGYVRLLLEAEGRNELVDLVRDAERMIFGEDPGPSGPPPDDQGDPVLA
ncbi:MAG TPA: PTS fructose transporter subunit IIA [Planctomycetes bacterium]|nr:PTS fructose transporter subunit IIA [Planctomycetota bacterium]